MSDDANTYLYAAQLQLDRDMGDVIEVFALQEHHWWNLDGWLAPIILRGLQEFRKNNDIGCPMSLLNEDDFDPETGIEKDGAYERRRAEFERMQDNAIWAFQEIANDTTSMSCGLVGDEFVAYTERIEQGLRDFATIFRGLWD